MKDLTSSESFRKDNVHRFDKMVRRVITSDQWDSKLEEIKEWEDEQERLKNQRTQNDLGESLEYEDEIELSPEERAHQLASTKKSQYGIEIDNLRKQLGINQNTQFSGMGGNFSQRAPRSNIFSRWLEFGKHGRSLSVLEIENNKKLLSGAKDKAQGSFLDGMMSGNTSVKETDAQQEYRMNVEDWKSYLYSYRLSSYISILSLFGTVTKMNVLFAPSYYPLLAGIISMMWIANKLHKEFDDGPLNGNYFGSENRIDQYTQFYREQEARAKENTDSKSSSSRSTGGNSLFDDDSNIDDFDASDFDDLDFGDDFGDAGDISSSESSSSDKTSLSDSDEDSTDYVHQEKAQFDDDGTSIPESDINVNNNKELYEAEEVFLKMVYENRAELSKHLDTPYDILKTFAPLIVNFNDEFADTRVVPRDSWEFKNIAYLIGSTYEQFNGKFRSGGTGKDAKYNPDYYFFIDKVTETGLFYKIKIRLPDCIQRGDLLKNMENMKANLKQSTNDTVDISTELPNTEGFLKIYKITSSRDGKNAFLPLVSTGDVMRFNNMQTTGGKPLIEDLNDDSDLKILMGLSNAEEALTLDIAGDQNTSIAIAGFTGSGKTASTGSWLTNILVTHSPSEVGFIVVDPKSGSFWENFKLAPHTLGYFNGADIDKVPSMMSILNGIEEARQHHLTDDVHSKNYYEARKLFKSRGNWDRVKEVPRLFIVMDEQLALISQLQNIDGKRGAENKSLAQKDRKFAGFYESYKSQVGGLANIVREGGMTIMALSQRTVDKAFPRSLLAASSIKFMMKLKFPTDAAKLMGEGAEYPDPTGFPTGSGYLAANGLNLTQLTTPLFSGNPDKLEEVTRIIALAWAIIYDYDHDLSKEPPYYYLSQKSEENVSTMQSQGVELYNLFNRDQIFKQVKQILRGEGNQRLHFDPEYETDFCIDLDKPQEEQPTDDISHHVEHVEKPLHSVDNIKQSAKELSEGIDEDDHNEDHSQHQEPDEKPQAVINDQFDDFDNDGFGAVDQKQNESAEDGFSEDEFDKDEDQDDVDPYHGHQFAETPDQEQRYEQEHEKPYEDSSERSQLLHEEISNNRRHYDEHTEFEEDPIVDYPTANNDDSTDHDKQQDGSFKDNRSLSDLLRERHQDKDHQKPTVPRKTAEDEAKDDELNYSPLDDVHREDYESELFRDKAAYDQSQEDEDQEESNIHQDQQYNEILNQRDDQQIEDEPETIDGEFTDVSDSDENDHDAKQSAKIIEPKVVERDDIQSQPQIIEAPTSDATAPVSSSSNESSSSTPTSSGSSSNAPVQEDSDEDGIELSREYADNPQDMIQFIKDQGLTSIETRILLKYFSQGTVMESLQKKLISIDTKTNKTKIIYN